MTELPEALNSLSPDQMLAIMERMRTIARNRQGAALRADAQARVVRRSAASYAGEFFERQHAQGATAAQHGPDPAQIAAELERIRAGNVAALLAKGAPSTGCWAKAKLPRAGWALLRIEDTGQIGGAVCELCDRAQMRFSYVLSHPQWPCAPADAGADTYACRLCAAHLLGGAPTEPKSRRKKAEDRPTWVDGPNGHRVRNGELRPDFKGRRMRDVAPLAALADLDEASSG